jgi:hypothetical protein
MQNLLRLSFFLSALVFTKQLSAQHQHRNAIGLRLGEPAGLTFKKFFPNQNAFELVLGTAASSWSHNYYANSFDTYTAYKAFNYRSHRVQNSLYLQARYLLHNDIYIEGLIGKLDWYWGLGGLLKTARIEYRYQERQSPFRDYRDTRTDLDFGPEVIIGMEYRFENIPLSVFGEISLFFELADRPFVFRAFSGAGVRYHF